jgi:hypothetical protein
VLHSNVIAFTTEAVGSGGSGWTNLEETGPFEFVPVRSTIDSNVVASMYLYYSAAKKNLNRTASKKTVCPYARCILFGCVSVLESRLRI